MDFPRVPTFGVDGTGVRLCALSDSVDYLALLQAAGDLPAVTVLPGQSGNPGTSEGTAMLEILHDLAGQWISREYPPLGSMGLGFVFVPFRTASTTWPCSKPQEIYRR